MGREIGEPGVRRFPVRDFLGNRLEFEVCEAQVLTLIEGIAYTEKRTGEVYKDIFAGKGEEEVFSRNVQALTAPKCRERAYCERCNT